MQTSDWYPYEKGQTFGGTGSENGVILRDEEHPEGARITLERDGSTPFAITCGIYGWLVHTCFFSTKNEAEQTFEDMKRELARIATLIPLENDPQANDKLAVLYDAFDVFIHKFQ